jgi:pimeloyl-ACP methyl ester carboxylesterase
MTLVGPRAGAPERTWEARLVDARRSGDPAARAALIEEFMPLANRLAWRYRRSNDAHDDLVQVARKRRVVTFDNAGVGGSTGTTPSTIAQMARDAIAFLDALELDAVDLLGFSIGSFVAQEIALIRPAAVRRLVLASAAPRGAAGMHGWAPDVIGAVGAPAPNPDGYLGVFFTRSAASRQAGVETLGRLTARRDDRDKAPTWQTRQAQYDAVCEWGIPDHGNCSGSARSACPSSWPTAMPTR